MSPQPKDQPKDQDAPKDAPATDNGTAPATDMQAMVGALLDQADALKVEKDALFVRVGANRDMLRNLVKTGAASDDQVKRIDALYPPRKSKGEGKTEGDGTAAADTTTDAS